MNNPHVIVGPNRQCLCGQYQGEDVVCGDILDGKIRLALLVSVLWKHTTDCSEPFPMPPATTSGPTS
jgi:hypothetical protein